MDSYDIWYHVSECPVLVLKICLMIWNFFMKNVQQTKKSRRGKRLFHSTRCLERVSACHYSHFQDAINAFPTLNKINFRQKYQTDIYSRVKDYLYRSFTFKCILKWEHREHISMLFHLEMWNFLTSSLNLKKFSCSVHNKAVQSLMT